MRLLQFLQMLLILIMDINLHLHHNSSYYQMCISKRQKNVNTNLFFDLKQYYSIFIFKYFSIFYQDIYFVKEKWLEKWKEFKKYEVFWLVSTERYGSVQYGTQLCPFPLSEVVNGTKIANRTVTLFWYPFVGVPSTAKGTKRVELNSLQNVDWLTRIVTCACYKGMRPSLVPLCCLGLIYIRVCKHKKI